MTHDEKSFEEVLKVLQGKRILVANRGIPARRIARSIKDVFGALPVMTVSDVDKTAPWTAGAHELMYLGPNLTYLDIDEIINRAKMDGIVAIHPGWGFASENEEFPDKCRQAGLTFIGPTTEAMRLLGNKVEVRKLARQLDIPVVPGSDGAVDITEALRCAEEIGLPIMLKAEGGGGGRGIYEIYDKTQLNSAFVKASTLAQASFGNPHLFVERLLTSVRHIEIQVIADQYGNVFAFDERDCTIQRNHQKLIEITPSPWSGMTEKLRAKLKEYGKRLVKAVKYHSLVTIEFLVDQDGNPYLIEANTRLQVEHGITECRYGIDLVEEQISVAFGGKLRLSEEETKPFNHAIQVRINCENPRQNFEPNAGIVRRYISPGGPGIRVDSCISSGYDFPSQYDSAAALLIAYGKGWNKVLGIMDRALSEYVVSGVKTTIPFHRSIINHPQFIKGDYTTQFVSEASELMCYKDTESEAIRLSLLIAEISAFGYNPYLKLGEYRKRGENRVAAIDPILPRIIAKDSPNLYPRGDRDTVLDFVRSSDFTHFCDTTTRDITQSNSGNRFRLAEDRIVGPYLDKCGFFSIENGGGAHFHVAMMANMTYPFTEAAEWNKFAPNTMKQILIRSTNILGYKPQPRNLMKKTGEMICEHYDIVRCFDFLNHIDNMRPFAEVVLDSNKNIFEPSISLSYSDSFSIEHYIDVASEIVKMTAQVGGWNEKQAQQKIILGLKDMAGVCPPRFMKKLVLGIRSKYPDLVLHYHRHYTDGLFVPSVGAAALAGAHIIDTGIGSSIRWYGQGDVLSTAAYIEGELGLKTKLNFDMIRNCNFVLKQIIPYFDKYAAPFFQGIDYDVVNHGMPGGATSSSQEGALKQGYIHLLPHMLKFLTFTRKIVKYHDVTPGSQITWNTAFLAVTGAFKRGGINAVRRLLTTIETVAIQPEEKLTETIKNDRLHIYKDSNDAFRDLLLGKFGKLPLGFPSDWVYQSAFGVGFEKALATRSVDSPLLNLQDIDLEAESKTLNTILRRNATEEELILYLNHPGDALNTFEFQQKFGDPNQISLHIWFEGLEVGEELLFQDSNEKYHTIIIGDISIPDIQGFSTVRYTMDSETFTLAIKTTKGISSGTGLLEMADPKNPLHIGAPSNGDLWVMYVEEGDFVKKGDELCNISIMKQEKSVCARVDGVIKRILKKADYQENKKMVPVLNGELLIELMEASDVCKNCSAVVINSEHKFCASCGTNLHD